MPLDYGKVRVVITRAGEVILAGGFWNQDRQGNLIECSGSWDTVGMITSRSPGCVIARILKNKNQPHGQVENDKFYKSVHGKTLKEIKEIASNFYNWKTKEEGR